MTCECDGDGRIWNNADKTSAQSFPCECDGDPTGWTIRDRRWPEPEWVATHADFDASYEGPEDGWVSNGLSCTADTREELLAEIAEIEAEHPHFARGQLT